MTKKSKTKHLEIYRYLLAYEDTTKIPYKALGQKFGVHQNVVIACVSRAKTHPTIYHELKGEGYTELQIPPWFQRPSRIAGTLPRNAETAAENAETVRIATPGPVIPIHRRTPYPLPASASQRPAFQPSPSLGVARAHSKTWQSPLQQKISEEAKTSLT